jgi:hypothetical protein
VFRPSSHVSLSLVQLENRAEVLPPPRELFVPLTAVNLCPSTRLASGATQLSPSFCCWWSTGRLATPHALSTPGHTVAMIWWHGPPKPGLAGPGHPGHYVPWAVWSLYELFHLSILVELNSNRFQFQIHLRLNHFEFYPNLEFE